MLQSTNATANDTAMYQRVFAKLYAFFQVRQNVIYEHARLNRRLQQEREKAEQYIVAIVLFAI